MQGFNPVQGSGGASALAMADYVDVRVLAAGVAETITVPAKAFFAIFSADGDFFVRSGAAAAIPAADVIDGTGSLLNPYIIAVQPADTIGIIASVARVVTISYYGK